MKVLLLSTVLLGACDAPPLRIVYEPANSPGGATCGTEITSLTQIPLECDAVLSLRILDPGTPSRPFVSVCQPISRNSKRDLSAIGSVDLQPTDLPKQTLEVQALVWPRAAVTDPMTGELDCLLHPVTFDAVDGYPISALGDPQPAFGGHTYFHPGDTETVIKLGCILPEAVNAPSCAGSNTTSVTSSVLDFETRVSVGEPQGNQLTILVGEPKPSGDRHVLNAIDAPPLHRAGQDPPTWAGNVDISFDLSACIEVLEDGAVTTLHCSSEPNFPQPRTVDIAGVRLPKATLDQVLKALSLTSIPDDGITIGIVVDSSNNPVANVAVNTCLLVGEPPDQTCNLTTPTLQYLSADRKSVGGTVTSSAGIFISTDAPYLTLFSASTSNESAHGVGGAVAAKVTIVILQLGSVIGGS